MEIAIVGAGIGGLTLALMLHRAGLPCRVYESASSIRALGVGINLLPHASKALGALGLEQALARVSVLTQEAVFYNRFGQLIHQEPLGRAAGYADPQYSIHRGDLQMVLLDAVRERMGDDAVVTGWRCTGFEAGPQGARALFVHTDTGEALPPVEASAIIGCDGLHSAIRRQLHPDEGPPRYSGVNMWRGVTVHPPILSGASMIRAGWLANGKMVIYPIRNDVDGRGNQLVNWVAEIETPHHQKRDWNRAGRLEDFIGAFEDWTFDWLDVPALIRGAQTVLEFPMIDQDPLPFWTRGTVTLLGDAAHPMVPRGSNGAGQAVLDAVSLTRCLLASPGDAATALAAYEAERLPITSEVVLTNRRNPPDAINREVFLRTGDKPFTDIDQVISRDELRALSEGYKKVARYDRESLS